MLAPDILVFANARMPNDRLLAEAARLAKVPRVVLELPNLFPEAGLAVDAMVAPSHYAALHPSVQALARSRSPPIPSHVITPGVDEARFVPRGWSGKRKSCDIGR